MGQTQVSASVRAAYLDSLPSASIFKRVTWVCLVKLEIFLGSLEKCRPRTF
ncbi:unnamed protein product, partial [Brassica oleracea]